MPPFCTSLRGVGAPVSIIIHIIRKKTTKIFMNELDLQLFCCIKIGGISPSLHIYNLPSYTNLNRIAATVILMNNSQINKTRVT